MDIELFNTLSNSLKASHLWENGTFFQERIVYGKFIYKLYSLQQFYVEVEYSIKSNEILSIVAYNPLELADSYVNRRDLDYAWND